MNELAPTPPTVAEMKWRTPKRWASKGIKYQRSRGAFVALETPHHHQALLDRLALAAEASRRIVKAWAGRTADTAHYKEIREQTTAYLRERGLPHELWQTVWTATERVSGACQRALKQGQSLTEIEASLQQGLPRAFATRLLCGQLGGPLERDGDRWRLEPRLWVTSTTPLSPDLNVTYGEIALIGSRWATRFVITQWADQT